MENKPPLSSFAGAGFRPPLASFGAAQPQGGGFIHDVAADIARPFARVAANVEGVGLGLKGFGQTLVGNTAGAQQTSADIEKLKTQGTNFPLVGNVKPVGQDEHMGRALADTLGVGTEIASTVIPAGKVGAVAKTTLKGALGAAAKEGAKIGATGGGLYGVGREMQNPTATPGSVAIQGLIGGATGLAGGAALGTGGAAVSKVIQDLAKTPIGAMGVRAFQKGGTEWETFQKRFPTAAKELNEKISGTTGRVVQGQTGDIAPAQRALSSIDTKGVKTYEELNQRLRDKIPELANKVDTALAQDTGKYKLYSLATPLSTKAGGKIHTNYVKSALEHLDELYQSIGEPAKRADVQAMVAKANKEGITRKEVNDISRTYGQEFGTKAFNKVGDPLTSVNAQKYENVRSGLKDVARLGLGGNEAKESDKTLSAIYNTQRLTKSMQEAVNKAEQRVRTSGLGAKVGNFLVDSADLLTGGVLRGAAGALRKHGNTSPLNAIELEQQLEKNLSFLTKALKEKDPNKFADLLKNLKPDGQSFNRGFAKLPAIEAPYKGEKDLTTKILDRLVGKSSVSKQFISDLSNAADLKQPERDMIRAVLGHEGDKVDVNDFANKVKAELLPLERKTNAGSRYENIALPDEVRGPVADYKEHIYESPIKTGAGKVHFSGSYKQGNDPEGYFAHTRVEDLSKQAEWGSTSGNGDTRRVIELQSDLFQKGRLENELPMKGEQLKALDAQRGTPGKNQVLIDGKWVDESKATKMQEDRAAEMSKLEPYRNTWQDRIVREEVKQAAKDGKTKLQFPTGETAMRVEGLAGDVGHVPQHATIGDTFEYGGEDYRIIDEYGGNEVSAIPDAAVEKEFSWEVARDEEIDNAYQNFVSEAEDGDISRFVNPGDRGGNYHTGTWLPEEFQKGYKKAQAEAEKVGNKEPIVNFLSDHEDDIRSVAENEIHNQYKNAKEMAEYFNDNMGEGYFAQGDTILYTGENGVSAETMQRGTGELDIDKDNPIYKFYEKELGRYLTKKYGAERIVDPQGVSWYQVPIKKDYAKGPVEAFGIAAGAGLAADKNNEN